MNTYGETPTPAADGTTATFSTVAPFVATSTRVYLNGERQLLGAGNDYTEGPSAITFANPPPAGARILLDYVTS